MFLHVLLTTFHSVILLSEGLFSNIKVVFNTGVCNTGTMITIYMGFHVALCIASIRRLLRSGPVSSMECPRSLADRHSTVSVSIPVCFSRRLGTDMLLMSLNQSVRTLMVRS